MEITYKQLAKINFPIFKLPNDNFEVQDGLILYSNKVVDDLNQIGDTLGARRLQTPHRKYKLNTMYSDLRDFLSSNHRYFIDYYGFMFIYTKTRFEHIHYHKIIDILPKDTQTVLKLEGVRSPVIVKRPPPEGMQWVGMLYIKKLPWLPYEYSRKYYAKKRKKI